MPSRGDEIRRALDTIEELCQGDEGILMEVDGLRSFFPVKARSRPAGVMGKNPETLLFTWDNVRDLLKRCGEVLQEHGALAGDQSVQTSQEGGTQ